MTETQHLPDRGYRYVPGGFPYSAGVAAEPGFAITRVRLLEPLPLAEGFACAEAHLAAAGRAPLALCACELRSPAPLTETGFAAFNRAYVDILERWGICRDGINPVARTNVCPAWAPPAVPSLHAFSYTVPTAQAGRGNFIVAGGGEAPEGKGGYRDHIVRPGDTSWDGLSEKLHYVAAAMEQRLAALGFGWRDASAINAYSIHDVGMLAMSLLGERGGTASGLAWHPCRPPIVDLDYEMDVRCVAQELVL